jgi:signal transduction histidine kinase
MSLSLETIKALAPLWSGFFAVLDSDHIVRYVNPSFFAEASDSERKTGEGKRVEEYFGCTDGSSEHFTPRCGTRESCTYCTVHSAINEGFRAAESGRSDNIVRETTFISRRDNSFRSYELRIVVHPAVIDDRQYVILIIEDISDLRRRQLMEKIFFHDILNTISSLTMNISLLTASDSLNECHNYSENLEKISDGLTEEIRKQRLLSLAETGRLNVERSIINLKEFIDNIVESFAVNKDKAVRNLTVEGDNTVFISDNILLRRIITNMIKNAVEASDPGDAVSIVYKREESGIKISVHNNGEIPPEIQARIFHQFHSTKGKNRGLGTYSIRLLTENYLKGTASFTSDSENGTVFTVVIPDLKKPQQ